MLRWATINTQGVRTELSKEDLSSLRIPKEEAREIRLYRELEENCIAALNLEESMAKKKGGKKGGKGC